MNRQQKLSYCKGVDFATKLWLIGIIIINIMGLVVIHFSYARGYQNGYTNTTIENDNYRLINDTILTYDPSTTLITFDYIATGLILMFIISKYREGDFFKSLGREQ